MLLEGGDSYAFAQTMPNVVVSPAIEDTAGFVADAGVASIASSIRQASD